MCTVSWVHTSDGYQLLCNRDERLARKPAVPAKAQVRNGVKFIAPIDEDYGGFWIAVNHFGFTISLLNEYPLSPPLVSSPSTSRGLLLKELVASRSLEEAATRIVETNLRAYQPFKLVMLEAGRPSWLVRWKDQRCQIDYNGDDRMPLTSSSFNQNKVASIRKRVFAEMATREGGVDSGLLYSYHSSHKPLPTAYSPCMHRPGASTVSFSWIRVSRDVIEFLYHPGPPCQMRDFEWSVTLRHIASARSDFVNTAELPHDSSRESAWEAGNWTTL